MILWHDGGHSAPENMRRDAALLARVDQAGDGSAEAEPVLRLFQFVPAGITLGRAQAPERTLDLDRCREAGIEWAVRPTGGRAIYHDDEWTYSFVARINDPEWGGSLHDAYARVSRIIHASLVALSVPARLVAGRSTHKRARADTGDARPLPSCFASTARHELELDGHKLAGSAQRRTASGLLQQGSILLGASHLRLADVLRGTEAERDRARRDLAANTAPAGPHLGPRRELACWADAIAGVLAHRPRRVVGAEGAFLLTPLEAAPYTASLAR